MKKLYTFLATVLINVAIFAQAPEKMSYQAVVRDNGDNLVTSQPVGMQISILQTTATGTAVYVETQTPTTNVNGLVTLEIGTGTVISGDFAAIDWSADSYFIKTETDPAGGTSYTITGTSQLLSVPYALHAKTADNAQNAFSGDYNDLANNPWDSSGSNIYNTNTNNVGIGTSTPQNALDVRTTNDTGVAIFKNDLPSWAYISIGNQTTGASGSEGLMLGYTPANVALIRNLYNSPMTFWTNNQERLRLSADGDVGIGTSTPSTLINAVKNQNAQTAMSLENLTAGTSASVEYILRNDSEEYAKLGLRSSASNTYGALSPNNGYIYTGATAFTIMTDDVAGVIKFATGGNIEKMRLSAAGELGIGTTNPTAKLDLIGSIKITDGTQGVGKILTSDANGLASWTTPTNGTDDQTASEVVSTAVGNIEATDVDAAIAELEAEKAPISGPTFVGNNVTFQNTGNIALENNLGQTFINSNQLFNTTDFTFFLGNAVEFNNQSTSFNTGALNILNSPQGAGYVLTDVNGDGVATWQPQSGATQGDAVGTTDTQTLSNKTLVDDTTYIIDNNDNTKRVQFEVSNLSPATTRTVTLPDANTTLVGTDAIQTLTNKTINSVNNTILISASDVVSGTFGDGRISQSSVTQHEAAISHQNLIGAGTNTHTQIDSHIADTNNPHSVTKSQIGLSEVQNIKVNLSAVTAPTVNSDNAIGYSVGSRWIDITNDKEYVCLDNTSSAAVWIETTNVSSYSGTTSSTIAMSSVGNCFNDPSFPCAGGTATFNTETVLSYTAGSRVRLAASSDPENEFFEGVISSYDGVTMVVEVDKQQTNTNGTFSSWIINLGSGGDGFPGPVGEIGPGGFYSGGTISPVGASTYTTVASFIYDGFNDPQGINTAYVRAACDPTATYDLRLYDFDNATVMAELTGLSNTSPAIQDLGAILNSPFNLTAIEIQIRRSSGTGTVTFYSALVK